MELLKKLKFPFGSYFSVKEGRGLDENPHKVTLTKGFYGGNMKLRRSSIVASVLSKESYYQWILLGDRGKKLS